MDREKTLNLESSSGDTQPSPKEIPAPKKRKSKKKKAVSKKRFVKTVKVFLTEEELDPIIEKCYDFGGISNYIRHHLGLTMNTRGRKKKHTGAAFDLDSLEL